MLSCGSAASSGLHPPAFFTEGEMAVGVCPFSQAETCDRVPFDPSEFKK